MAIFKRPILVVDDEPEILRSLHDLLRREFQVYTASTGEQGLALLEQHEIHVVISDQRMPEMTGVDLLARVRCEHPESIRLIFTGYADQRALIDAINRGNVFRYVSKPWDPDELLAALRAAGAMFDRIAERQTLLRDVRAFEKRCIHLHEALQAGQYGTLAATGVEELGNTLNDGRSLCRRLDAQLGGDGKPGTPAPPE